MYVFFDFDFFLRWHEVQDSSSFIGVFFCCCHVVMLTHKCEQMLDSTRAHLSQSRSKDETKEILIRLVGDLIREGGFDAQGEELKEVLQSLRPLVAGQRLRFDDIIRSGVAEASQSHLHSFWGSKKPSGEGTPSHDGVMLISDQHARKLWMEFETAISSKDATSMKRSLLSMQALGIPIPPVIWAKVNAMPEGGTDVSTPEIADSIKDPPHMPADSSKLVSGPPCGLMNLEWLQDKENQGLAKAKNVSEVRMLKPSADGRVPSPKEILKNCWQVGFYKDRSQVVPLTYKPATQHAKKTHVKRSNIALDKDSILIGLTMRLQEGGGAVAFYTSKGKAVLTGRDENVISKLRDFVRSLTVPAAAKNKTLGWGLPDPSDFLMSNNM